MVTHTPSVVKSRVVDVSGIEIEMCTFTSSELWVTSVSAVGLGDLVTVEFEIEVERDRSSVLFVGGGADGIRDMSDVSNSCLER